jgi:iron complex transport system substrate-binding protein
VTRADLINAAALLLTLTLSVAAAVDPRRGRAPPAAPDAHPPQPRAAPERLPDGREAVRDASGRLVPIRPYRRIVSATLLTDRLLVELAEPDRILAFSAAGARGSPWRHQYAGKPSVDAFGALEPLVALKPDLVLMNTFGKMDRAARLRAAGIEVFDLGEQRGLATLGPTAEALAALTGAPGRGRRLADALRARLGNVAARLGDRPRRRGIYLSAVGGRLYGGTRGTSYHDVLEAAGLADVAAGEHRDWPEYTAEQVLRLAPELVVSKEGGAAALCATPGLAALAACRGSGRLIEVPAGLLDEPGPAMLDAAEWIFARAYPDAARGAR